MEMHKRFIGKTAIVTGGGGNIGRYTALRLAQEGCSVVICDLNEDKAAAVAAEIRQKGGQAVAFRTDVKDSADVRHSVAKTIAHFGQIDILVCCAGGSTREKMCYFCDQTEDVILDNIGVNLFGALFFAHAVCNHMIERKQGRIIFIASVLGTQGQRGTVEYSASKGGVLAMTKALSMELGEFGVTVNAVSPGLVERGSQDVSDRNYIGRNCTADDIANAVAFLASEEASFITGANLTVDGGWGLGVQSGITPGRNNYRVVRERQRELSSKQGLFSSKGAGYETNSDRSNRNRPFSRGSNTGYHSQVSRSF